jgi:AcrR family transcriptional regulator
MQYLSQRLAAAPTGTRDEEPPRGALAGDQRERLLDAAEALIAEKGATGTTIEAIVKAAGISTVTFYEQFRDKDECFVAAFERAVKELRAEVGEAVPVEAALREQVSAGLEALLTALDAEPSRARLCFVEAQRGGPAMAARYDAALDAVAATLDDSLGQAIAGGLAWLLRQHLEFGGEGSVRDLLPQMTDVVLAPGPAHG